MEYSLDQRRYRLDLSKKKKGGEMTVAECCSALNISRSIWYNLTNGCISA